MSMILPDEFDAILREYGHTEYLWRRKPDVGAGPYREVAGGKYVTDANGRPVVEAHTIYRSRASSQSVDSYSNPGREGFISDAEDAHYFRAAAKPKTGDIIVADTPHDRQARELLLIKQSFPYYLGNTLVYFKCLCERMDPVV